VILPLATDMRKQRESSWRILQGPRREDPVSVVSSTLPLMALERWQYAQWLGLQRGAFTKNPEAAVIPYVRALNSVALDELSTSGPNDLYDEAEAALEQTIEEHGATPAYVTHLVKILINDAQANAFSGGPNWPDQGRALDAAERAVRWQQELVDHMSALRRDVPDEDRTAVWYWYGPLSCRLRASPRLGPPE